MQWKLPKWQEKQKILYISNKASQQKIEAIIEQALNDGFHHEALLYISKLTAEEKQQSYLKKIADFAIETGDIFIKRACSSQGYNLSNSESGLLEKNAEKLGKSFALMKQDEDDDS